MNGYSYILDVIKKGNKVYLLSLNDKYYYNLYSCKYYDYSLKEAIKQLRQSQRIKGKHILINYKRSV